MTQTAQNSTQKYFSSERLGRILPALLLSVALFLMLFVVGPLEIYVNNMDEFRLPANSFVGFLVLYFAASMLLNFALLFFLPEKAYKVVYIAEICLLLLLFMQGTFLNFEIHSLPADNEIRPAAWQTVIDLLVWCVVIAGIVLLAIFIKKHGVFPIICLVLSVAVLAAQIVSVTTLCATSGDLNADYSTKSYLTDKNLTTLSKNRNVLMFCIDRFDTVEFADPAVQEHPEIFQNLTGFTYFRDNVPKCGHTYLGMATMVTNLYNYDGMTRKNYFNYVYNQNKTISLLHEEGYLVNIYTDDYYGYDISTHFPEYIANATLLASNFRIDEPHKIAWEFVKMELYRCVPLPMKNLFKNLSSRTVAKHLHYDVASEDAKPYSSDMKDVYHQVQKAQFQFVQQNVFSYIHITGCHYPFYDDNWNRCESDNILPSVKHSIQFVEMYIAKLKEIGAYENSTIIVAGDHSIPYNDMGQNRPSLSAMFVKPSGAENLPMQTSSAQVSHDNMWATIFQSEHITPTADFGRSMFDIPEGENVPRLYICDYDFFTTHWRQGYWEINGSAWDFDNWTLKKTKVYNHGLYA